MTPAQTLDVISNRYILQEELGRGGMGAVYKATDRLTGQTVALKRVMAPMEEVQAAAGNDSSDYRVALSNEFRVLASLRHPNIIRVLDYGFDQYQQPYFTMQLIERAQTLLQVAAQRPLAAQIGLLLELLQALSYLHQRGIVHRDLKPGNVLVDSTDRVKVLDFGLSLMSSYSLTNIDALMVGTLPYMAPELFQKQSPSNVSDLYAVGVMFYQLLVGSLPFAYDNYALLINDILHSAPDISGLDPKISAVVERLLAKQPQERYPTAREAIIALCEAAGLPYPEESRAVRESYLQAARFVGRTAELSNLGAALDDVLSGSGAIRLVGGESGVGKSRLLDELRIHALVKGVAVLRGQAVREGSSLYHIWREPLRHLVLSSDPTDEQAAMLKALIPDIDRLLGRSVDEFSDLLFREGVQARLFATIKTLLRELNAPVMILLEDLHWARGESLALLRYLSAAVDDLALLLVGDFRNDERPGLPKLLGHPPLMTLHRLDAAAIAELSAAMLGSAGKRKDTLDLLQRESEGNAYFLIEVVRALAEEAGDLSQIGMKTLPQHVFTGEVQAIVDRRLSRVAAGARPLLQLAAIAGRRLDAAVLQHLAPNIDFDAWLTHCINTAVIDAQDGQFAHHKLRERLLDELDPHERPALYRQVAQAIEATHPDAPQQAASLAHLWRVAGDNAKELRYTREAGFRAYKNYANDPAIEYFSRAIELIQLQPEGQERTEQELQLQVPLSMSLMHSRGFTVPEVEEAWLRARALSDQLEALPQLISILGGMCQLYHARGEHDKALDMDNQLIALAPQTEHPLLHTVFGSYTASTNYLALGQFDEVVENSQKISALYDAEGAAQAITILGENPWTVSQLWLAIALQLRGFPNQARRAFEEAMVNARQEEHPFTLALVLTYGWIPQLVADFESAYQVATEALALNTEHGFRFGSWLSMPTLGWAVARRGQFEEGIAQINKGIMALQAAGAASFLNYFFALLAESYALNKQIAEALGALDEAVKNIEQTNERFYEPEIYHLRGEMLSHQGAALTDVESQYCKAIEIAQEREARWLELRATVSLARLWNKQGKTADARQQLGSIYGWFTEGFDTLDMQEAKILLDELS